MFAFGSNLDESQMRRRCPSASAIGVATLPNHRLAFLGWSAYRAGAVASVLPAAERDVPGLMYRMTRHDVTRLDAYEGGDYRRVRVAVRPLALGWSSGSLTVETYMMDPKTPEGLPSLDYLGQIAIAYGKLGLPKSALVEAARWHRDEGELPPVKKARPKQLGLAYGKGLKYRHYYSGTR